MARKLLLLRAEFEPPRDPAGRMGSLVARPRRVAVAPLNSGASFQLGTGLLMRVISSIDGGGV